MHVLHMHDNVTYHAHANNKDIPRIKSKYVRPIMRCGGYNAENAPS